MNQEDEKRSTIGMIDNCFLSVTKILAAIAAIFLVLIMLIAFVDALMGKLFVYNIPHANEFITYSGVPIVFLALAYTQLLRRHTTVELLTEKMPRFVAKILTVVMYLASAAFCFLMTWRGIVYTADTYTSGVISGTISGFKVWPFAAMMVVGWITWGAAYIWDVVRLIVGYTPQNLKNEQLSPEDDENEPTLGGGEQE